MQNNEIFAENPNFENAPLIRIELNAEGKRVVSARELHAFLEVQTRFNDWFSYRVSQYSFRKEIDFTEISVKLKQVGRPEMDYALTLNTAKELAMVENNDQGKKARLYFLWCEENLKNSAMLFVHQLQYEQDVAKIYNNMERVEGVLHELYSMVLEFQREHKSMKYHIYLLQRIVLDLDNDVRNLKNQMEFTQQWLEEVEKMIEELTKFYGLDVECFVYVFLNPLNGLYKIGRSKRVGTRKKAFQTVQKGLKLVFAIPTLNHDEAVSLENNLHKRFANKLRFGEWYALANNDLRFLQVIQEAHRSHIVDASDIID